LKFGCDEPALAGCDVSSIPFFVTVWLFLLIVGAQAWNHGGDIGKVLASIEFGIVGFSIYKLLKSKEGQT